MRGVLGVLGLLLCVHTASAVTHSYHNFYTASSGVPNFPEFVMVGMVDGVQVLYYDSITKRAVPKQDWMNNLTKDEPQYWERNTQNLMGDQQVFKVNLGTLKQRFNQSGDGHIIQQMYGCSWDEETGVTEGFQQYGYDGEDFLSFDLRTLTWIAPVSQAVITKHRWDSLQAQNEYFKHFLTQECIEYLKKYLQYGESALKTVPPSVSLLQKTPSSPVTCHATGFYPSAVMVFWTRDGQLDDQLFEDVEYGELLPNHDGTFQMSTRLLVKPEDWEKNQYDCVVQLSGMEVNIVIRLERSVIKTNRVIPDPAPLIIGVVVGFLLLIIITTVFFIMKKKRKSKKGFSQASTSDDSSNNSAPKA